MKKVILGSALIIGGILLSMLSILAIGSNTSGLILAFPVVGIIMFLVGCGLGISGIQDDK